MGMKMNNYKNMKLAVFLIVLIIACVNIINFLLHYNENKEIKSKEEYINNEYIKDAVFDEVKYFPIALPNGEDDELYYDDSYGNERTYGGERVHEGIDIFTKDNIPGQFPIVSVCDGVIEKIGWLELGGYRIGIRSKNNIYYYYAHLHRYDEFIYEGATVYAGQIIGYIGDTGYSKVEGTRGNFPVHLHFGVYIKNDENDISINPYILLNKMENSILIYDF
jgi:murein DD-endopeptidase MepM/ murein hydrolase activator NlpD